MTFCGYTKVYWYSNMSSFLSFRWWKKFFHKHRIGSAGISYVIQSVVANCINVSTSSFCGKHSTLTEMKYFIYNYIYHAKKYNVRIVFQWPFCQLWCSWFVQTSALLLQHLWHLSPIACPGSCSAFGNVGMIYSR